MKHLGVFFFNLLWASLSLSPMNNPVARGSLFNVISNCFIKQTAAPASAALNLKSKCGGTRSGRAGARPVRTQAGPLIYCEFRRLSLGLFRDFFVQILDQTQFTLWAQILLSFFLFNSLGTFFLQRLEVYILFIYWLFYFTNIFPIPTKSNSFTGWRLRARLISEFWSPTKRTQGMMGTWKFKDFKGVFAPRRVWLSRFIRLIIIIILNNNII